MFTPQPFISWSGKRITSFTLFGTLGFTASLSTTFFSTLFLHLSLLVWLIQTIIAITVFFSLAELMNRIKGTPVLVYYHHELAIVLLIACFLLFAAPHHILQYLDITATGLGIFLVFGRIGCFMAGCCHGKPSCFGIHYQKEHVVIGFPYYYLGARLFPVQLIEATGVLLIVIFMMFSIILQEQSGTAFALYILCYGLLRFLLEFARGDISRPYYGTLSEAQWFSVALSIVVLIMSFIGWFPGFIWHLAIVAIFCGILSFFFLIRKASNPWLKIKNYQIRRLAILVDELYPGNSRDIKLRVGKNTILVTAGILNEGNTTVKHFTISMYPGVEASWMECIGNMIYSLQNQSGVLTKLNKTQSMMHFIIKIQHDTPAPNVISEFWRE